MANIADIAIDDSRWVSSSLSQLSELAFETVLTDLGLGLDWEISLLACSNNRIAELNSEFRNKPAPTNVLSWPSQDLAPETEGKKPIPPTISAFGDKSLGDIAIGYEVCQAEAQAQNIDFEHHCLHLLMHGCLHLLGFDHETDADAALMEGMESRLLAKLGIADPYRIN